MATEKSPARFARILEYTEAHTIVEAALATATAFGVPMSVAVLDSTQAPIAFARNPEAAPFTAEVATSKARTALLLRMSTTNLFDATQPGAELWGLSTATHTPIATFGGGIPLVADGVVIGAVGTSGGSVEEDITVASAAVSAFEALLRGAER